MQGPAACCGSFVSNDASLERPCAAAISGRRKGECPDFDLASRRRREGYLGSAAVSLRGRSRRRYSQAPNQAEMPFAG